MSFCNLLFLLRAKSSAAAKHLIFVLRFLTAALKKRARSFQLRRFERRLLWISS